MAERPEAWADLAYTAQIGRTPFEHRAAVWAADATQAAAALTRWREKQRQRGLVVATANATEPRAAFVFTGQGSQYRRMGRELYETSAVYRDVIDRCLAVAEPLLGVDLRAVLFPTETSASATGGGADQDGAIFGDATGASADPIDQTQHTQVLIFATEMALAALWRSWGLKPAMVLGHSIGEYAAACTAGVFSLEDGVRLTVGRGQLMQAHSAPGRMLTVFGERAAVEPMLASRAERVSLAAENGPGILLISGEAAAITALAPELEEAGFRTTPVPISHAFHSPLTEPVLPAFRSLVESITLRPPTVRFISNLTGTWATDEVATADYWVRHLREAVQFSSSMTALHGERPDFIIEVGPEPTLMGLDFCFQAARAATGSAARWLASLKRGAEPWLVLSESLGRWWAHGGAVDWSAVHAGRSLRKVEAPKYAFQRRRYWLDALTPGVAPAPEIEVTPDIPVPLAVEAPVPVVAARESDSRAAAVIVEEFVHGTICEVSGLDPADLAAESNLLEMGLDSLMFVRMGRLLERRFAISISAKQFYDDLHRVGPLTAHLLAEVSEEVIRRAPAPEAETPVAVASPAAVSPPVKRNAVAAPMPAPPPAGGATMRANFAGLELEPHPGLTAEQAAFVAALVERLGARTAKSREFTQAARRDLADWKHSLQFKLSLKGLKYPVVAERSEGARIHDIDGNSYLDFALGMGVHYLGHQPPYIVKAVQEQAARQMGLGPQSDLVAGVARQIREMTGVERVSFTITGTQAVTLARRVARAATGRTKIVQFAGAYHGIDNDVLVVGTEDGPRPLSPGTPQGMVDDVVVLDYNSPEALARIEALGPELAAVLVEPVQSRRPGLQPHLFLRKLRRLTRDLGIPLIFDEMINGFRVLPGGAQAWFGIEADIVTYGKIVGGGLPLAVVAGKAKYLDWIDGGWWQFGDDSMPKPQTIFTGGTHNRHPLALAAAGAALTHLARQGDALAWEVNRRTTRMIRRLNWFFEREDVPIRAGHFGSQFRLEAPQLPFEMEVLHYLLLEAGIYTWEQRTCCISTVHTDADCDHFVTAVETAVRAMRAGGFALRSATILRRFVPMSSVQRRLFALCQREGGEAPYHLSGLWRLDGPVDFDRLQEAFQEVQLRHESLRTAFLELDGEWLQEIIDEPRFAVERVALAGRAPADALTAFIRPFDLAEAPLWRVGWAEDGAGRSWLMLDAHHLAVDGLSMETVLREFCALYDGAVLPRVARQYRTAQAQLESAEFAATTAPQEAYWLEQLAGERPTLNLPLDYPRPRIFDFRGDMQLLELGRAETAALRAVAKAHGCSFYIVLMTGFALLLERLTGQSDLIVGLPVAGRGVPENDAVVGMFVNTLALRLRTDDAPTVAELLRRVRDTCFAAYENQEAPLSRVLERLGCASPTDRNGLFDVMFSYENADRRRLATKDLQIHTVDQFEGSGMFDFNLDVIEEDGVARVRFHYATSLFAPETIARWRTYYANLLRALASAPAESAPATLALMPAAELEQLARWERDEASPVAGGHLLDLWSGQVAARGEAVALQSARRRWTYRELDTLADRLAMRLREETAIEPGAVVAVAYRMDAAFMVAVLAIWKCRFAYVPLDPQGPGERNADILRECEVDLVLAEGRQREWPEVTCWSVDLTSPVTPVVAGSPPVATHPGDLAYVLFTSGSTGRPKGVEIGHDSIARAVRWRITYYAMGPADRTLQLPAAVFDASILDVWSTLGAGATLVVPTAEQRHDLGALRDLMRETGVTNALITPSLYSALLDVAAVPLARMRACCVAGEALSLELVRRHHAICPRTRLINEYGPTENSVVSTAAVVPADADRVTIGRPVAGTRVVILDRGGQRCAPGVAGEIWLNGPGLARGYRGRPELTAERFMSLPNFGGERFYRTGDLGRWRDGEIDYLGRQDHQVKLRGFRIELGEVEAALRKVPGVRDAMARVIGSGSASQLAGYVVADAAVTPESVRADLWHRLPDAMVPARLWRLDAFPLTVNGKVDWRALPTADDAATAEADATAWQPETPAGRALARVVGALLPNVTVTAAGNFFALGGDSIRAIQMISRLRAEGWALAMPAVYRRPTLADLAEAMAPTTSREAPFDASGPIPASGLQQWWWRTFPANARHGFAQGVVWRLSRALDVEAWRRALRDVAQAHPAFAVQLAVTADGTLQQRVDLTAAAIPDRAVSLEASAPLSGVREALGTELNAGEGPMALAARVERAGEHFAVLVVHHAVVDGVSWRVIEEDLRAAYAARLQRKEPALVPPTNAYREWHETLAVRAAETTPARVAEIESWAAQTAAALPDRPPVEAEGAGAAETSGTLASTALDALLDTAHQRFGTQGDELLLTAWVAALSRWSKRRELVVELEGHGRAGATMTADLGRTVGWFTSAYPVKFADVDGGDWREAVRRVKETVRSVPEGGANYRWLEAAGRVGGPSVAEVSFNFLGRWDESSAADGAADWRLELGESGAVAGQNQPLTHAIALTGYRDGAGLQWRCRYDARRFSAEAVATLFDGFAASLEALAQTLTKETGREATPADFTFRGLNLVSWDALLRKHEWAPAEIEDVRPVSPMQQGLWFQALMDPQSDAYFQQMRFTLTGVVSREALAGAWADLAAAHDVARTVFVPGPGGVPLQVVRRDLVVPVLWPEGQDGGKVAASVIDAYAAADRARRFELAAGPLMRVALFAGEGDDVSVVWSHHHLLMDGWCVGLWMERLLAAYAERRGGAERATIATESTVPYYRWLESREESVARQYWSDLLAGHDTLTTVSPEYPAAAHGRAYRLEHERRRLGAGLAERLKTFAQTEGVTLATVLNAAATVALGRYAGRRDVVVGSIVSGRPAELPGVERMMGLFINAVPVRHRWDESTTWAAATRALHAAAREAEPHHHYALARMQEDHGALETLFDHLVVYENYPMDEALRDSGQLGELGIRDITAYERTHYALSIIGLPVGDTLELDLNFDAGTYARDQVARLGEQIELALQAIARTPEQAIESTDLLPVAEAALLRDAWNATAATYPREATLVSLFAESAKGHPAKVALRFGAAQLTYAELAERSDRVAHALAAAGVRRGDRVAVWLPRGLDPIVAFLGVAKVGAAYVPLDPGYPAERVRFMVEDAGCAALIDGVAMPWAGGGVPIVRMEDAVSVERGPWISPATADDSLYVIYTSGSTGRPKGCEITHRNVVRLLAHDRLPIEIRSSDVWLVAHSLCFDFSVWETYGALLHGGTAVVAASDDVGDPRRLADLIGDAGVTILSSTPGAFYRLADEATRRGGADFWPALRYVTFGGDRLECHYLEAWRETFGLDRIQLINMYGITETTVHVTQHRLTERDFDARRGQSIIGQPLPETEVWVCDEAGHVLPIGAVGELFVGGSGLARGYLNRPELTAERFVPHPLKAGERAYRTGDLGRWLSDGTLEYLGRNDHQVQVRGYRVELGEIEASLLAHPGITQAVVMARTESDGTEALAAYLVGPVALAASEIQTHLEATLPRYMVPSFLRWIPALPLTGNGKVDRRALAAFEAPVTRPTEASAEASLPALTAREQQLAAVWSEVLEQPVTLPTDDFFMLGGHSLKAMRLVALLEERHGWELPVGEVFQRPTLAEQAARWEADLPVNEPAADGDGDVDAELLAMLQDLPPDELAKHLGD